jgi:YVTN family beta-propeller protein
MSRYVAKRLVSSIALLFLSTIIIFLLMRVIPGDPTITKLGGSFKEVDEETLTQIRHELGLDKSIPEQYVSWISGIGQGPRHLVISPDGAALYATLNAEGKVAKIDPVSGAVLNKVSTGNQPRSMAISTDGQSLYVVNYESSTMSKLSTTDLSELQTVQTGYHPIGITYDRTTGAVWVANYGGTIQIFSST